MGPTRWVLVGLERNPPPHRAVVAGMHPTITPHGAGLHPNNINSNSRRNVVGIGNSGGGAATPGSWHGLQRI